MPLPLLGCALLTSWTAASYVQLAAVHFADRRFVPDAPLPVQISPAWCARFMCCCNVPAVMCSARMCALPWAHPYNFQWLHCFCGVWRCVVMPSAHQHIHVARSRAFCPRSLFAFGMSAFVFGWCFRAGSKPPCIHVFRSTCIFPFSCAVITLCEDFCRCPCAHTQCARNCESSLWTLPAVSTALFYRSVYSIAAVPLAESFLRMWMFISGVQWMRP